MALKRVTFTCTTDANGLSEDDAIVLAPSTRDAFIEAVLLDDSAAFSPALALYLYQIEADDDAIDQEGTQLFNITDPTPNTALFPRVPAVDVDGVALANSFGRPLFRSKSLRVNVAGGVSGDIYTVYVYYETAGDWRF